MFIKFAFSTIKHLIVSLQRTSLRRQTGYNPFDRYGASDGNDNSITALDLIVNYLIYSVINVERT